MQISVVELKAQLLSNGVSIDKSVLVNYDKQFIEKRRAYGIQDPDEYLRVRIPQELVLLPENCVCSININKVSPWLLCYSKNENAYIIRNGITEKRVTFPIRPAFYDKYLLSDENKRVNQVITLYGGHSLGVFLNRNCCFESKGVCHFCSLCNNHKDTNDFDNLISFEILLESLKIVLEEPYPFSQIMLNGGNLDGLDNNFSYYANHAKGTSLYLVENGYTNIELHLITSPPKDLGLLEDLAGIDIKIAINMETISDKLFAKYCPGKDKYIGHQHIKNALTKAVDILGKGKVYTILVGGLEPLDSLKEGIEELVKLGVIPVINVLHVDPNTLIGNEKRPSVEYILESGKILQQAYRKFPISFSPFYDNCGRNSIDTEAHQGLFQE